MLAFWILVLVVSFLLAKVEINIEGKYGYAEKLPVEWRTSNKWLRLFLAGTSYHLYMGLLLLCLVHLSFAVGLDWTLRNEMLVLSWLAFVTVFEDFLWFVLNPHYGIKKFRRGCIPWFRKEWLWFCPIWYWFYIPAGIVLFILGKGG